MLHVGPFMDEDEELTRRQVDVNLHGTIHGMKLVLPAMVARRSGHVINVASTAARAGIAREAVYSATKHAVLGLSEAVRAELRGSGVDLSVVLPGLVRTDLAAGTVDARGVPVLQPEVVAEAIVGVIRRPRFEVYVPRSYGRAAALGALLPRRSREADAADARLRAADRRRDARGARGVRGARARPGRARLGRLTR